MFNKASITNKLGLKGFVLDWGCLGWIVLLSSYAIFIRGCCQSIDEDENSVNLSENS